MWKTDLSLSLKSDKMGPIVPGMPERTTVSISRACEIVGVSRRTIYNWIADGKIQYVRTAGGSVRIFADTLWRTDETKNTWIGNRLQEGA